MALPPPDLKQTIDQFGPHLNYAHGARLDTSNGAVAWSVTGGGVHWLGFGDPDAGTLQGLAQPHVAGPGTPPAILHAIDFASGAADVTSAAPFFVGTTLDLGVRSQV